MNKYLKNPVMPSSWYISLTDDQIVLKNLRLIWCTCRLRAVKSYMELVGLLKLCIM